MSNWLENAENSAAEMEEQGGLKEKLRQKKEAIRKNYLDNQIQYENFIAELDKLVNRVNDLPLEYREPFGKISHHKKDSRLDNHLNYLSSSQRIKKRLYKSVIHFLKIYTFKRIRVAYFTVSSHPGKMDVEIKENLQLKVRMNRAGENERLKYPGKRKNRKDYRFRLDLNNIGEKEAMDVIDWLAFKIKMEEISFFEKENQAGSS